MYEEDNRGRSAVVAILGVVAALALIGIIVFKASKPESVPAPTAYRAYSAPDKSFACKAPEQWHRQETGGLGIMSGVTMEKSGATISILSDLEGSLMGDIARAASTSAQQVSDIPLPPGMAMPKLPPVKPPVEQLHLAGKRRAGKGIEGYSEGDMHEFPSPLGEARVSEWTGGEKGPLGLGMTKVHGYRTTILGRERRVTVVCKCSEADWPKLRPAFQTVMASLAPAGG